MGANQPNLPAHYVPSDVKGITEGGLKPTVYFHDGSHFTQSHWKKDNIGYHRGPLKHLFFGNVSSGQANKLDSLSLSQQEVVAATFMSHRPDKMELPGQGDEGSLLEITHHPSGAGFHLSRSSFTIVHGSKKRQLLEQIRSLSTNKGKFPGSEEFVFMK